MSDDVRNNQRRVSFYNASGGTIPPYAVINLVSDQGDDPSGFDFCRRLKARQYTDDADNKLYALNGRAPVLSGKYGECFFPTNSPAFASVDQVDLGNNPTLTNDAAWFGQEWGPVDGKWTLSPKGKGFTLMARPNVNYVPGYSRVLVMAQTAGENEQAWFVLPRTNRRFGGNRLLYNVRDTSGTLLVDDISFYATGKKVTQWNTVNTEYGVNQIFPKKLGAEADICFKFYDKLAAPGELVLAKKFPMDPLYDGATPIDTWMVVRGGTTFFPYCKTAEDINPAGTAVIYYPRYPLNQVGPDDPTNADFEYPLWPQSATVNDDRTDFSDDCVTDDNRDAIYKLRSAWDFRSVRVVKPITMEPVPAGTWVSCEWQGPTRKLIITGLGCPCFDCLCP